jgi:DNA modification methylase
MPKDFSLAMAEEAWCSFDRRSVIYRMPTEKNDRIHPTQKPLQLIMNCLSDFSKDGDLVLDCFSGSGTTAIACHRLNRRFICIEKDKEYWEASCKRLEDERKQLSLFGGN